MNLWLRAVDQVNSVKKRTRRRGSQSSRPGHGPLTKPTWPPSAGCSKHTWVETSAGPGGWRSGQEGGRFFFGLMTSVGNRMSCRWGLLEARSQ